jgi:hypothetical protein
MGKWCARIYYSSYDYLSHNDKALSPASISAITHHRNPPAKDTTQEEAI